MTATTTIRFHFVWCALMCAGCRRAANDVPALPASQSGEVRVRAYPDPGHRLLGVYAGGLEPYFDYQQKKITLEETFPGKAGWWANLKASADGGDSDACKHDVYVVYCGERGDPEAAKKRLDAWLKPEPGVPTYPELIPAVSLGEENEPHHRASLDALARHVRETYGIPVFQWYTDPLPPGPDLTADGWIWDSYLMSRVPFRKHLMKFVVLGKPAACVLWATDPHWPSWKQYPDAAALMDALWHQFDVCREFNVSCVAFAVAGPTGSVGHWRSHTTKDMEILRNALREKREEMKSFGPGDLPLASADFSARDRCVSVGGDAGAPGVFEEDFTGFGWIHDADIRGFLGLRLTSRPADEPGFLLLKTDAGHAAEASLTYRCESYFPLESVRVTLNAAAPAASRCRNTLSVSADGETWLPAAEQRASDAISPLTLDGTAALKGKRHFYLRAGMAHAADRAGLPGNRLDRLRVEATWLPPPQGASAALEADLYGNLAYEDDFATARWRHFGELRVAKPDRGGYRDSGFWVGSGKGYANSARLSQRVSAPRALKELTVVADCGANGPQLAGSVLLQVARSGETPKWEIRSEGIHKGPLLLRVPSGELAGVRNFDVHVTLLSGSGVELGTRACATLSGLRIRAR